MIQKLLSIYNIIVASEDPCLLTTTQSRVENVAKLKGCCVTRTFLHVL